MSPLKKAILEEIKVKKVKLSARDNESLAKEIFLNSSSLRLSYYGYTTIRDIFTPYSFEMDDTIRPKHLIVLAKSMKYPYYLSRNRLILFSDSDALVIKLYGNVNRFLENGLTYFK
jgi:hypothetical protein